VDFHFVRRIAGVRTVSVLSGLFGQLLRRQALRAEGRIGAHRTMHVTTDIPKLVSTALPVRLCGISVREVIGE
jgi:hypothetical protein